MFTRYGKLSNKLFPNKATKDHFGEGIPKTSKPNKSLIMTLGRDGFKDYGRVSAIYKIDRLPVYLIAKGLINMMKWSNPDLSHPHSLPHTGVSTRHIRVNT